MTPLLVAMAGGLGAVIRFIVDAQARRFTPHVLIPLGTLIINVTGSFALGVVTGWWAVHTGDPGLKQIIGTGFLGGYTTFSTASVEAARLARAGRGWSVMVHVVGMLLLSVTAAAFGVWLGARP